MRPPLFLHIGHSKVASSTIQSFIDDNVDVLRGMGFLAADSRGEFPEKGPIHSCPVPVLQQERDADEMGVEQSKRRLDGLHEKLTTGPFSKAIISAENLCNPRFEKLFATAREKFEVHVIYYIRRQDDWLVSSWKQWGLKSKVALQEYCTDSMRVHYPDFPKVVERWTPLADKMHVRVLHPSVLADGKVTSDFARALGLDPAQLVQIEAANRSFDASVLDVLSHNPQLFESVHDNRVFEFLERFLPNDVPPARAAIDPETRKTICEYFEKDNRLLMSKFFPEANFEALFGLRPDDLEERPMSSLEHIYRYLGLHLSLLMKMQEQFERQSGRPE